MRGVRLNQDRSDFARDEFRALDEERDPELHYDGLLALGRRLLQHEELEKALRIFHFIQENCREAFPKIAAHAGREIDAIEGRGAIGSRVEFLSSRLVHDAADPKMLVGMTAAGLIYDVSQSFLLSRFLASPTANFATRGFGARALAGSAAFSLEAPGFVAATKGAAWMMGDSQASTAPLSQELASSFLTLGGLKVFGALSHAALRSLGPHDLSRSFLSQAGTYLGILAGHGLEHWTGLRPISSGDIFFVDALMTLGQFHLGGAFSHKLLGENFGRFKQELHLRSEQAGNDGPGHGWRNHWEPLGAMARRAASTQPSPSTPEFLSPRNNSFGSSSGGSDSFDPKSLEPFLQSGEPPPLEILRAFRRYRASQVQAKIQDPAEKKTLLAGLAEVHQLLNRFEKNPDPALAAAAWRALQAMQEEFEAEPAPKTSTPLPPQPPPSRQSVDRRPASPRAVAWRQNALKSILHNSELLGRQRNNLQIAYEKIELRLLPAVQEKYLQALNKARLTIDFQVNKVKSAKLTPHKFSNADLVALTKEQAAVLAEMKKSLEELGHEPLLDPSQTSVQARWKLRDYQQRMLGGLNSDLKAGEHPWLGLASPMQTGKSYLAGPLIETLRQHFGPKARFIILSSARIITAQVMDDLLTGFPPSRIGRFDGLIKDPKDITVASIHSLARRLDEFPKSSEATILINDEAYSTQTPTVGKIYRHFGFAEVRRKDGEIEAYQPRRGKGIVVGLSGTGAGLQDYALSGELNLLNAIKEGWIRHMTGERVLLKIQSQEVIKGKNESMIWWEPTEANAKTLTDIYHEKIHGKHDSSLVFAPAIRHGELLQAEMARRYGKEYPSLVHSRMKEEDAERAITEWEKRKGPLISVKKLSRGFRGTGTAAVFHTYQTTSMELFAQRTGRAWGLPENTSLPNLYVLEATWNPQASFANLARLLGLADYPRERLFTQKMDLESLEKPKLPNPLPESEKRLKSETEKFFSQIPTLEGWRTRFEVILAKEGGVNELVKKVGLPREVLSGYALGALPLRLTHALRLEEYLGGREKALQIWVRSWEDALAGIDVGSPENHSPLEKNWIAWKERKAGVVVKAAELGYLLREGFPSKRGSIDELVERVFESDESILSPQEVEAEVKAAITRYSQNLDDFERHVFKELLMNPKSKPLEWWRERGVRASLITKLNDGLALQIKTQVKDKVREKVSDWPLDRLDLSLSQQQSLQKAGIFKTGDLLSQSGEELLAIPGFNLATLVAIEKKLPAAMKFRFSSDPKTSFNRNIEELGLRPNLVKRLLKAGIRTLQDLQKTHPKELMLEYAMDEIRKVFSSLGLETEWESKPGPAASQRNKIHEIPLSRLNFSNETLRTLEKAGFHTLADWKASTVGEIQTKTGLSIRELIAIRNGRFMAIPLWNSRGLALADIGLSPATLQTYHATGAKSLGEALQVSKVQLLKQPNIDIQRMREARDELERSAQEIDATLQLEKDSDADFEQLPVEKLELGPELSAALKSAGYRTARDLLPLSKISFLRVPGAKLSSMKKLRASMSELIPWHFADQSSEESWAEVPLDRLELSAATLQALDGMGNTIGELRHRSASELRLLPEMNPKRFEELHEALWSGLGLAISRRQVKPSTLNHQPIERLYLPATIQGILKASGISTIAEAAQYSQPQLLQIPGIYLRELKQIDSAMENVGVWRPYGLDLGSPLNQAWKAVKLDRLGLAAEDLAHLEKLEIHTLGELWSLGEPGLVAADANNWSMLRTLRNSMPRDMRPPIQRPLSEWEKLPLENFPLRSEMKAFLKEIGFQSLSDLRKKTAVDLLQSGLTLRILQEITQTIGPCIELRTAAVFNTSNDAKDFAKVPLANLFSSRLLKRLQLKGHHNLADLAPIRQEAWIRGEYGSQSTFEKLHSDLRSIGILL